jgi:hypothetical protein
MRRLRGVEGGSPSRTKASSIAFVRPMLQDNCFGGTERRLSQYQCQFWPSWATPATGRICQRFVGAVIGDGVGVAGVF